MSKLIPGIYEEIITNQLSNTLSQYDNSQKYISEYPDIEAPYILSSYLQKIIENKLLQIQEKSDDINDQISLVNNILKITDGDESNTISSPKQLLAISDDNISPTKAKADSLVRPETSISHSSLFTGSHREPNLYSEINKEIESCDSIDMMVSFIRWSGVSLIIEKLQRFTDLGHKLRIITTSYMGATEFKAIDALSKLSNTEIKINYDVERTRLHAKSYIFKRNTGYSTAYVGSSNLTAPAMTSGCEWNVKFTKYDSPTIFSKVEASYEGYWNSPEYELYDSSQSERLIQALSRQGNAKGSSSHTQKYYFEPQPYPYQEIVLKKLEAERLLHNNYRNLVVAATGTGKTIIAAFDYKNQCLKNKAKPSLLFIAHRKEILEQSIECFREVLGDSSFADLLVGNYTPFQTKFLFVSNDMCNNRESFYSLPQDYYDYIVIDECHHMPANTYQKILNHFTPKILLGLTATPDRMDGNDILKYFNNRITSEISLSNAIDRKLLCPFQYFALGDDVPLDGLKWTRGGYDVNELENVYVINKAIADKRAALIIKSLIHYGREIENTKGLVFCVSVAHAEYMSHKFNEAGISSAYLSGSSTDSDRSRIRSSLEDGSIKLVCVVDLYNEGVDIKQINTVLFLRPTNSQTIFLQQLGRGLRIAEGKDCLIVLDFIGQANKYFNFEAKFKSLLQDPNLTIQNEINSSFPHLPKGCYIHLEKKAKEIILSNIRNSLSEKCGIIDRLREYYLLNRDNTSFAGFISANNISPLVFYTQKYKWTFTSALALAINKAHPYNDSDPEIWKKIYRFVRTDDINFLNFSHSLLATNDIDKSIRYTSENAEYWNAFYGTLYESGTPESPIIIVERINTYLRENPSFVYNLKCLLDVSINSIDFIPKDIALPYDCSLKVHCTYTRRQALAYLNYWKISSEGVTSITNRKTTCLFVTLNKSNSYYSPSTSYHDYSINENYFHWQSQNSTSENTEVGKKYINHITLNETILLFVREQKQDKYGSVPFTFLGKVYYDNHTGNKPMNITWRLEEKIPARFINVTDQLGIS